MEHERFDWDATGNLTPMGQVASYGRLARGAKRFRRPGGRGPNPWVWVAVAALVLASVVLALLAALTG